MKTKASEIILENGIATYAGVRTVASELKIPEDAELIFIDTQSRWTGTGYTNYLYQIVGTDDLVIVRTNDGPVDNLYWDNAVLERGYFAKRRNYAKVVGTLSKKYKVPFELALAVGENEELYPQLIAARETAVIDDSLSCELNQGIERKRDAILKILGYELFEALNIGAMGQKNVSRIAGYLDK